MFRSLCLNEGEQTLIVLGSAQELERDTSLTDRAHHRGNFERRLLTPGCNLEVENIVDAHLRFTLNDASAHRQVEHRALAAYLSAGERQVEPYGNAKMLAAVDWVAGAVQPDA